jgi:hypothetical protein
VKVVLSYVLAIGGVGAMLYALSAVTGRFTYGVAKPMILHLLRTNPHQAEAMCRAGRGTFLEAVAAAFKTAVMMKTRDPGILAQASRPAYDAHCMQLKMHWKSVVKRVKTAALLAIGAVALAIYVGASPILHVILGVVTLAGGAWVIAYRFDVERSVVLARAEVLPEVDRAIAEGRYVLPQ